MLGKDILGIGRVHRYYTLIIGRSAGKATLILDKSIYSSINVMS